MATSSSSTGAALTSVESLLASLTSSLQRIAALEARVTDLQSKQDVIAVDVGHQSTRMDLFEQQYHAGGDDWYQDQDQHAQQEDELYGSVTAAGGENLRGTQLNASMHTPPQSARGNLEADEHRPCQQSHFGSEQVFGGALRHLSLPPAAADLHRQVAAGPQVLPSHGVDIGHHQYAGAANMGQAGGAGINFGHIGDGRDAFRRLAGGTVSSLPPTSPVSLAPQSTRQGLLDESQVRDVPPNLRGLFGLEGARA